MNTGAIESTISNVVGGETALANEMATLRSKIRHIAIESLRGGVEEKELAKLCLEACDTNRSKSISIGLQ